MNTYSHEDEEPESHELKDQATKNSFVSYRNNHGAARCLNASTSELTYEAQYIDCEVYTSNPTRTDESILFGLQVDDESAQCHVYARSEECGRAEKENVLQHPITRCGHVVVAFQPAIVAKRLT